MIIIFFQRSQMKHKNESIDERKQKGNKSNKKIMLDIFRCVDHSSSESFFYLFKHTHLKTLEVNLKEHWTLPSINSAIQCAEMIMHFYSSLGIFELFLLQHLPSIIPTVLSSVVQLRCHALGICIFLETNH